MMVVDNKFEIGQTVYLRTDKDQLPRMLVQLNVGKTNIMYLLACGMDTSIHVAMEITGDKVECIKNL
jgi:hypothetical protein